MQLRCTTCWETDMGSRYSTIVQWSEEDESFVATAPEFPHLSSFGDTAAEAVEELHAVIEDVLDILDQEGKEPPAPQQLSGFSGQFRVRLPRSLHRALVLWAKVEDVSLNQLTVSILSEGLGPCPRESVTVTSVQRRISESARYQMEWMPREPISSSDDHWFAASMGVSALPAEALHPGHAAIEAEPTNSFCFGGQTSGRAYLDGAM